MNSTEHSRMRGPGKLSALVRETIVSGVSSGELKPGDPILSEGEIARQLGVSKTVVREGLRELSSQGVLEIRHGRPSVIRAPAADALIPMLQHAIHVGEVGFREFMELQCALLTYAARLAAENRTQDDIINLKSKIGQLEDAQSSRDRALWNAAQFEFQISVVAASKNSLMHLIFKAIQATAIAQKDFVYQKASRDERYLARVMVDSLERQKVIFRQIEAGSGDLASVGMREHFEIGMQILSGQK